MSIVSLMSKTKPAASPAELLDQLRAAQDQHAQTVAAANAELVAQHQSCYSTVKDRQETIAEQIKLLNAEADGLAKVAEASNPQTAPVAGQ